ncbi:MAG: ABC transporter permease [Hadesarchaea archaeon]|nr:ABC transporter permease [Hadesarchaea archaeon]
MSEFEKFKVVTRYELLKQLRRKRFYGGLGITVLAVLLIIGLYEGLNLPAHMGIPERYINEYGAEIFAMCATSMSSLAVLAAVFFSGDAIAGEFENRTGYVLFPNPVKRSTLVIGKYSACLIATTLILLVGFLISTISVLVLYEEVPIGILGSLAIALALACCIISMAFAFSSALKGSMGATIATLLAYMVIFPIISSSLAQAGYTPWFMPDRAADSMSATYDIPLEEVFGGWMRGGAIPGMVQASEDPFTSFCVLLAYAVVLLMASLWMTNRREMI